jgi:ABC-2 type transport system ATP-binding protein
LTRSTKKKETSSEENPILVGRGLEKTYEPPVPFAGRTVNVLTGADISLYRSEIVGIVGENGSGKSTLMKILVGALQPDGGTVSDDVRIGWCPQETRLYDRLTVKETFELFAEAYDMSKKYTQKRREELAEKLDFKRFLDYRIDHLSGGNRQKVNLSVALLHEPEVLLLDEPYTGFDWETYLAFWNLTDALVDRGTTIAIISHLISERERFDRILELKDGELHEQKTPPGEPRSSAHGEGDENEEKNGGGEN